MSPGEVNVSSEKVDEGKLSSIDGFSSNSSGFDMAVAFDGDSDVIKVDLTVRCSPSTNGISTVIVVMHKRVILYCDGRGGMVMFIVRFEINLYKT